MHPKLYAYLLIACLFPVFLSAQNAKAQNAVDANHVMELIANNSAAIKFSSVDQANTRISDAYYNKQSGTLLVYLQQTYKGIDVYNSIKVLAFKNDKLVSVAGTPVGKMQIRVNNPQGSPALRPENAVNAAAQHLNLTIASSVKASNYTTGTTEVDFGDLGISSQNVTAKLLWMPVDKGQRVKLTWQVQIQPIKSADHWLIRVDANDGSIVNKDNLTVSETWRVPERRNGGKVYAMHHYDGEAPAPAPGKDPAVINSAKYRVVPFPAEAPSFQGGALTLVTNPWLLAPAGSGSGTLKWNDDGTTSYAISRGNNVYAQEDHDNNNNTLGQTANSSNPLPDLLFDYPSDLSGKPTDSLYQGQALTNLFYWNNIMHDISYQYGFDELAGNFQASNLGRGGAGNDYVIADGQDGGGTDNANFATPADGQHPRMQMYLFPDTTLLINVNSPDLDNNSFQAVEGNVSSVNRLSKVGSITANVVLYKGQTGAGDDSACDVATNAAALKGKIALIFRGGCNFTVKIKNAQAAGAVGVIMADNVVENILVIMSTDVLDNSITIPAVFVSNFNGNVFKNVLKTQALNITLGIRYRDGDLDDGVMSHEYTHGISNRLTGGPSITTCLQNAEQMGEGWSDYNALMVTTDWSKASLTDGPNPRPLGTYVEEEDPSGPGIRNFPYSTDMTVDPWTYTELATETGGEVHNIGEIWATVLWDMTWNIIQQDGVINKNLYDATAAGGNTVALKLMMEGLKLQVCSPGFIDGRDAILKADTLLYNGKYSCSIWKAFARRGMGVHASEGSSDSYTDQTADFTAPISAFVSKTVDKDSVAQNDVLTYTLKATCQCANVSNFKITDTLPSFVTYVSGGTYNSTNRTVTFSGINLTAATSQNFQVKVKVNNGSYFAPGQAFADSVNSSTLPTATWVNQSTSSSTWAVSTKHHHTGSYTYFASDDSTATNKTLVTKNTYLLKGISTLSFWHYYNVESGYDGGVVEISTDGGTTWADLGPYMTKNGYNGTIDATNQTIISGRNAFTASSNNNIINTIVNLSPFSGKNVMIRFAFASDELAGVDGWYLDDITITNNSAVVNIGQMFNSTDSLQNFSTASTFIKNEVLPVTWGDFTVEKLKNTAQLNWETETELNTARFGIERSTDAANFVEIGSVQAAGNSAFTNNYRFIDGAPLQGINYYRLKQVDKDGHFEYSEIRSVNFNIATGIVTLSPNPAKDIVSVTVGGNTKALKVYLVNNLGQKIRAYDMNGQYMQLTLPNLAAGVYYIKIEGGEDSSLHKLLIK